MKHQAVSRQYAAALFQIAEEQNIIDEIAEDLRTVRDVFQSVPDLRKALHSPAITKDKKKEWLRSAFSGLSPYVVNMLQLLIDKRRIDIVIPLIDHYIELSYEKKGIAPVIVESVRPLKPEEQEALSSVFAKRINKKSLKIDNRINTDLLGGIRIHYRNRIFDGSLQGKLERLRRELAGYHS